MTFNRTPISVTEAQKQIWPFIQEGSTENVPLLESEGRYLAVNVKATYPIPHFRRSAMDGFAVRAGDTDGASPEQPVSLSVEEEIPAGSMPTTKITPGTCARIMTGGVVPEGADAVMKLEDTDNQPDQTAVKLDLASGQNVTEIGAEMAEDTGLMEKGRRIGAGELALLAMFGYGHVPVYRQPRVAILSTGSELLGPNDPLQPGKIRNSNSYMLRAQVTNTGAQTVMIDQVSDKPDIARKKIFEAFEKADIVVTTGGVSVGDYDILVDILDNWDGERLFNKIQMRPGSPTTVGVYNQKLLFALSGNPGACFAGFELFARPVLCGMQGIDPPDLPAFSAHLAEDFTNKGSFPRFVRGRTYVEDGKVFVQQVGMDKSSVVTSIKDADVLIQIPPGDVTLKAGDLVSALKLQRS